MKTLVEKVKSALTPDLLKPKWRLVAKDKGTPYCGHCYHATEALYWLMGGRDSDYRPYHVQHEGDTHWFLKSSSGDVLDPTVEQFQTIPPYSKGRCCGFLTKNPSKRAQEVMRRVADKEDVNVEEKSE